MIASSTCFGSIPARRTDSATTFAPSSVAVSGESPPMNFPIGVRTALKITGCSMILSPWHGQSWLCSYEPPSPNRHQQKSDPGSWRFRQNLSIGAVRDMVNFSMPSRRDAQKQPSRPYRHENLLFSMPLVLDFTILDPFVRPRLQGKFERPLEAPCTYSSLGS